MPPSFDASSFPSAAWCDLGLGLGPPAAPNEGNLHPQTVGRDKPRLSPDVRSALLTRSKCGTECGRRQSAAHPSWRRPRRGLPFARQAYQVGDLIVVRGQCYVLSASSATPARTAAGPGWRTGTAYAVNVGCRSIAPAQQRVHRSVADVMNISDLVSGFAEPVPSVAWYALAQGLGPGVPPLSR